MPADPVALPSAPILKLVRHELKRRTLTISGTRYLTPHMLRITLTGEDLADFPSLAADDHIKVFVPDGADGIAMRDYTPRSFSRERGELVLDFALHEAGPATRWALAARPGDTLEIGGPRGSRVITGDIAHWLLIGDETALPAIGRRLEEAGEADRFTLLATVPGREDEQEFKTAAELDITWIHGPAGDAERDALLMDSLRQTHIAPGTFIWIAAEGSFTREIRQYLLEERHHPKAWLKASGYWVRGEADATVKFD